MNLIQKKIENILKDAQIEEYQAEARLIIKEVADIPYNQILLGEKINNEDKLIEIAKKRATTKAPIQHILGYSYFMGEKYIVNNKVLIPRDETEILVLECFEKLKNKTGKIDVLDIGTGTGCISCALAKKLYKKDIEILAVDISLDSIEIALQNADNLNLIRKVIFRKSDIFSKIRDIEKFDLIVSNPPYIPLSMKKDMQDEVKNFEPELALFTSDENGIEFYKKIIKDAPKYLKKNGYLLFECGINESNLIKNLLLKNNFKNIEVKNDLANIERVISAQY